jgi:hypothetical protein
MEATYLLPHASRLLGRGSGAHGEGCPSEGNDRTILNSIDSAKTEKSEERERRRGEGEITHNSDNRGNRDPFELIFRYYSSRVDTTLSANVISSCQDYQDRKRAFGATYQAVASDMQGTRVSRALYVSTMYFRRSVERLSTSFQPSKLIVMMF